MYIIYKTTNIINGKFYIGVHKTNNVNFDGYLGSGKALKAAVLKHGRNNFTRETLFILNSAEDAYAKEKEIVTKQLILEKMCYNSRIGGRGLRKPLNNNFRTQEWKNKISKTLKGTRTGDCNPAKKPGVGKKISEAKKGKPNLKIRGRKAPNGKQIQTPSGIYETITAAAIFYKVSNTTISDWCRSSSKPFFYKDGYDEREP